MPLSLQRRTLKKIPEDISTGATGSNVGFASTFERKPG
jgi:hypothetical protein